ncbi:aldehyde oxidase-like [Bufo gargarizans]|uniref:aldehyde oxidase-like n=1 Tax=Bufo gargarizans TaxID=30331 RepID=UPI001CF431E3|nr:aldehyde oxidase-like [Bufo gargarizans]
MKHYMQSISLSATGYFRGFDSEMNWEKGEGNPAQYFVYGVACSEVEIDCLTGDHKNLRTDMVMDVGCSINPAVDIGQIEGAFVQGLGLFTIEELKFSPQGILYSRGPAQYKIPTVYDVPEQFYVSLAHHVPNPRAIYSSKGVGEPSLFLGSSIYFAIKDAIAYARKERGLSELFTMNSPATPEKIRMACGDRFTNMIPRDAPGTYVPWAITTVDSLDDPEDSETGESDTPAVFSPASSPAPIPAEEPDQPSLAQPTLSPRSPERVQQLQPRSRRNVPHSSSGQPTQEMIDARVIKFLAQRRNNGIEGGALLLY